MNNNLFPNHKPEDADLSKVPGYNGHPGQDRVKPDLNSQKETTQDLLDDAQKSLEDNVDGLLNKDNKDNKDNKSNKDLLKSKGLEEWNQESEKDSKDSKDSKENEMKSSKKKY